MQAQLRGPSSRNETVEDRIKLECVRRKGQWRRASISHEFVVPLAKSQQHEQRAQMRHHAFLQLPANQVALGALAERVRLMATVTNQVPTHALSPMDRRRLDAWATSLSDLLTNEDFVPSDAHYRDPLIRVMGVLRELQDGHVCLAEVAVEARQLLLEWENAGIFDPDDDESDDDAVADAGADAGADADAVADSNGADSGEVELGARRGSDRKRGSTADALWLIELPRRVEESYAYESLRERAAERVLKRVILHWVRSQETFKTRVAEMQIFGNTMHALMESLAGKRSLAEPAIAIGPGPTIGGVDNSVGGTNVIKKASIAFNEIVKMKRKQTVQHINFSELMRFSKHLALFTVDHALRRVDDLERKRRLLERRCSCKLQIWWRKKGPELKGRRLLQVLAEAKRQKQAADDERRLREMKLRAKGGDSERSKGKTIVKAAPPGKSGGADATPSSLLHATSTSQASSSRTVPRGQDHASSLNRSTQKESSTQATSGSTTGKESGAVPTLPSARKAAGSRNTNSTNNTKTLSTARRGMDNAESGLIKPPGKPKSRVGARTHGQLKHADEDEPDTTDVELAWQKFLDVKEAEERAAAAAAELKRREEAAAIELAQQVVAASMTDLPSTPMHVEWHTWSDDEDDDHSIHTPWHDDEDCSDTADFQKKSHSVSTRMPTPPATAVQLLANDSIPVSISSGHKEREVNEVARKAKAEADEIAKATEAADREKAEAEQAAALALAKAMAAATAAAAAAAAAGSSSRSTPARLLQSEGGATRSKRRTLTGIGQLSNMRPFAVLEPEEPAHPAAKRPLMTNPPPRRHLYEMDFSGGNGDSLPFVADMYESLVASPDVSIDVRAETATAASSSSPLSRSDSHPPPPGVSDAAPNSYSNCQLGTSVRIFESLRARGTGRSDAPARSHNQLPQSDGVVELPTLNDSNALLGMADTKKVGTAGSPSDSSDSQDVSARVHPMIQTRTLKARGGQRRLNPLQAPENQRDAHVTPRDDTPKVTFRKEDVMRSPVNAPPSRPIPTETRPMIVERKQEEPDDRQQLHGTRAEWLDSVENLASFATRQPPKSSSRSGRLKLNPRKPGVHSPDFNGSTLMFAPTPPQGGRAEHLRKERMQQRTFPKVQQHCDHSHHAYAFRLGSALGDQLGRHQAGQPIENDHHTVELPSLLSGSLGRGNPAPKKTNSVPPPQMRDNIPVSSSCQEGSQQPRKCELLNNDTQNGNPHESCYAEGEPDDGNEDAFSDGHAGLKRTPPTTDDHVDWDEENDESVDSDEGDENGAVNSDDDREGLPRTRVNSGVRWGPVQHQPTARREREAPRSTRYPSRRQPSPNQSRPLAVKRVRRCGPPSTVSTNAGTSRSPHVRPDITSSWGTPTQIPSIYPQLVPKRDPHVLRDESTEDDEPYQHEEDSMARIDDEVLQEQAAGDDATGAATSAAFQELLGQYLGLLQAASFPSVRSCPPTSL